MDKHKREKHFGEYDFKCELCDYKASSKTILQRHKIAKHGEAKEVCHICGKAVINLSLHYRNKHNEKVMKKVICEICGQSVQEKNMKIHIWQYHSESLICMICGQFFKNSKRRLIKHLEQEHLVYCNMKDLFVCHIEACKLKHSSPEELSKHLIQNHDQKAGTKCPTCEKSFPSKTLLVFHLLNSHKVNEIKAAEFLGVSTKVIKEVNHNPYPCDQCDNRYASLRSLDWHTKLMHEKDKHFKCEQCDFTHFDNYKMRQHVLVKHTEATKFPCDQCSFVSNMRSVLLQHIRSKHTKDLVQFPCTECDKEFERKSKLAEHLLLKHNIVYKYNPF